MSPLLIWLEMKTSGRFILFIFFILVTVFGIKRLRFDTSLTSVLPTKVAQVQAVQSFNQYFEDDQHVVIWLQAKEDKVYADDAADLATFLEGELPCQVTHSPDFDQDLEQYAREVAKVWVLSDHALVTKFADSLADTEQLRGQLVELKEKVRSSFETGKAIRHSYDPLGFLRHPSLEKLAQTEYSFESDDGLSRFLLVKSLQDQSSAGYSNDTAWVEQVRSALMEWNAEYDDIFEFGLTGGPVYNSEVGSGMQRDLLGTLSLTLSLIGLLFLLLQRSFVQLLVLVLVVAVTFLLTLGIAGWLMPSLSVLSIGFAAILLGLVIDYAIVLLRESVHFERKRSSVRRGLRPSVLWAAVTTSLVFSILMLSSFPGVRQLGLLILIGLGSGAYVMLYAVPWYIEVSRPKERLQLKREPRSGNRVLLIPVVLLLVGISIFFLKGSPDFSFALSSLQPKSGEASNVQKQLSDQFSSWSDLRTVVFASADSPGALRAKIKKAERAAHQLKEEGKITEMTLLAELIPTPENYVKNLHVLRGVLARWGEISKVAKEEGFTDEALKYDHVIAETFATLPATYEGFQDLPKEYSITKGMIAEDEGQMYYRGNITLAEPLSAEAFAHMGDLNSDGVIMTGWGTLSAALEPVVRGDFKKVFLPAVALILLALALVFRNWKEAGLVLFILITVLVTVNACMVTAGVSWNFLNIIGYPLILGVGIDYSIHLIFALRRQGQEQNSIWQGVGLAIAFCGLSSVVGFGSLALAQNDILRSLGSVCALGVFITMVLTLLIIPPVWRRWFVSR